MGISITKQRERHVESAAARFLPRGASDASDGFTNCGRVGIIWNRACSAPSSSLYAETRLESGLRHGAGRFLVGKQVEIILKDVETRA